MTYLVEENVLLIPVTESVLGLWLFRGKQVFGCIRTVRQFQMNTLFLIIIVLQSTVGMRNEESLLLMS